MTEEQLCVGVLVNDSLRRWQIDALEQMVEAGARIKTVIVNEGDESRIRYNLRNAPAYLFIAGSRELAIRLLGSYPYLESVHLSEIKLFDRVKQVYCEPVQRSDIGQELPESVVEEYCADLDFLVRFGFGILRGDVLDASRYGVFSYHHGDIREHRGRPAGFWEFMDDAETIGVTLQQLTDELDAGGVIQINLFEIDSGDTYQDILRTAYLGSVDMLAEAVTAIHNGEFEPTEPDSLGNLYTAPNWEYAVKYLLKNMRKRLI
jgi:hypothetical protein